MAIRIWCHCPNAERTAAMLRQETLLTRTQGPGLAAEEVDDKGTKVKANDILLAPASLRLKYACALQRRSKNLCSHSKASFALHTVYIAARIGLHSYKSVPWSDNLRHSICMSLLPLYKSREGTEDSQGPGSMKKSKSEPNEIPSC